MQKVEMEHGEPTEPVVLIMNFTGHPVERSLAHPIRYVKCGRCDVFQASSRGTNGNEAWKGAGFQQITNGLKEDNGANSIDLNMRTENVSLNARNKLWRRERTYSEVFCEFVNWCFVYLSFAIRNACNMKEILTS
jgi:hypothetical protein